MPHAPAWALVFLSTSAGERGGAREIKSVARGLFPVVDHELDEVGHIGRYDLADCGEPQALEGYPTFIEPRDGRTCRKESVQILAPE